MSGLLLLRLIYVCFCIYMRWRIEPHDLSYCAFLKGPSLFASACVPPPPQVCAARMWVLISPLGACRWRIEGCALFVTDIDLVCGLGAFSLALSLSCLPAWADM